LHEELILFDKNLYKMDSIISKIEKLHSNGFVILLFFISALFFGDIYSVYNWDISISEKFATLKVFEMIMLGICYLISLYAMKNLRHFILLFPDIIGKSFSKNSSRENQDNYTLSELRKAAIDENNEVMLKNYQILKSENEIEINTKNLIFCNIILSIICLIIKKSFLSISFVNHHSIVGIALISTSVFGILYSMQRDIRDAELCTFIKKNKINESLFLTSMNKSESKNLS
jgi:membrane-associated HD superfamily phosphohydrolase